jgi:hypothetical protein
MQPAACLHGRRAGCDNTPAAHAGYKALYRLRASVSVGGQRRRSTPPQTCEHVRARGAASAPARYVRLASGRRRREAACVGVARRATRAPAAARLRTRRASTPPRQRTVHATSCWPRSRRQPRTRRDDVAPRLRSPRLDRRRTGGGRAGEPQVSPACPRQFRSPSPPSSHRCGRCSAQHLTTVVGTARLL